MSKIGWEKTVFVDCRLQLLWCFSWPK